MNRYKKGLLFIFFMVTFLVVSLGSFTGQALAQTNAVTLSMDSIAPITNTYGMLGDIVLQENMAGALSASSNSVTLTLPTGFAWGSVSEDTYSGNIGTRTFSYSSDGRTLELGFNNISTEVSMIKYKAQVFVDESTAAGGDVVCQVGGDSSVSQSTLTVATYFNDTNVIDHAIHVSSDSVTTVTAGGTNQNIGDVVIKEDIEGRLISGRSIILTLPEGARWVNLPFSSTFSQLNGIEIGPFYDLGTDGKAIITFIEGYSSNSGADLILTGGKIDLAANFSGDVYVTVSGSAGASGEVKVATGPSGGASGSVSGSVQLDSSSDYSNIKVSLIGNTTLQTAANSDGSYQFSNVPAGNYEVVAGHQGFLKAKAENISVTSGQSTTIPTLTLSAGDLNGDNIIDLRDVYIFGHNYGLIYN